MIAASPYVRTVISLRSNASYFKSPVRRSTEATGALHHRGAASHVEYDSGDPARFVRGEEESRACNVLGHSESSDRVCIDQHPSLRHGDALLVAVREDRFRGDAIGADPIGAG